MVKRDLVGLEREATRLCDMGADALSGGFAYLI